MRHCDKGKPSRTSRYIKMGRVCATVYLGAILLIGGRSLLCEGYQSQAAASNALVPPENFVGPSTAAATTLATPPMEPSTTPKPAIPAQHPCTCGVFLGSQFKKGSTEQPIGAPALRHEQDRMYPCTPLGTRQCQNKCLESFVRHLPNAGSILCATLDRDCHKEKAFLFVQNCDSKWVNSNLSTGKEYCCKDGQQLQCPII